MDEGRLISGIVTAVIDYGSVVQVYIDDAPWSADGNMWRGSAVSEDISEGAEVEAYVSNWGGLLSIGLCFG